MITLSISTNFPNVIRRLDSLQKEVGEKALVSALNKTAAKGKTQSNKEIRKEFALTKAKVDEKLFVYKATRAGRNEFVAVIESRGPFGRRAINLINFSARQVRTPDGGVSVKIKKAGGRKLVKGAFIGNQGRTVFIREGKGRLPIRPVQTIDVPQMFNVKQQMEKLIAFVRAEFPRIFEHEADFYLAKYNAGR